MNRHAHLTASPIAVSDEAIAIEVHSRVAVRGHQTTAGDRLDCWSQLQQQGICFRNVRYTRSRWNVIVSKTFAAPLPEQKRLVDDAGKARLEQTLGKDVAFLAQLWIHWLTLYLSLFRVGWLRCMA